MTPAGDNPGVIAPPPLLYLGTLAVALVVDFQLIRVPTGLSPPLRYAAGLLLGAAATALAAGALARFRRAGTKPEPWHPTTAIVTGGVYAFTRNPMYVAMTLFYAAVSLAVDSAVALLLLVPLMVVVHHGVVAREERYLEGKFGDAYRRYKDSVRRWI